MTTIFDGIVPTLGDADRGHWVDREIVISHTIAMDVDNRFRARTMKVLLDALVNEARLFGYTLERGRPGVGLGEEALSEIGPKVVTAWIYNHCPNASGESVQRELDWRDRDGWTGKFMDDLLAALCSLGYVFVKRTITG